MKRLLTVALLAMALCLGTAAAPSQGPQPVWGKMCPGAVECPIHNVQAYFTGNRASSAGKCLCVYSHSWQGEKHEVVIEGC